MLFIVDWLIEAWCWLFGGHDYDKRFDPFGELICGYCRKCGRFIL